MSTIPPLFESLVRASGSPSVASFNEAYEALRPLVAEYDKVAPGALAELDGLRDKGIAVLTAIPVGFAAGRRARVSETAFPGSTDAADVAARGQAGWLMGEEEPGVWWWRGDDGVTETFPTEDELELLPLPGAA